MKIVGYNKCSELGAIEDAWNHLGKQGLFFVPSFSELRSQLEASGSQFRVLVAVDNLQIIAICCFIYVNEKRHYQIGRTKLFYLPARVVNLFGSCVLGQVSEDIIREFFGLIIKEGGFDLINVGNIFVDSPLYTAITSLHKGIAWRGTRKEKLWWLIRLPGSFDEYIASLRETTRLHITRDCRKFEREAPRFRIMTLPEEVDIFLRDAEKISQVTYQWNLNYGLRIDESARPQLIRLAKNGNLRCYISYLHGKPCAFGWGELTYRKFYFKQTGYDPRYRKLSPGTALIMRMIQDLIEKTNCEVFDFQWGGLDGYKSRFGTVRFSCASMQVAQVYRPYPLLIAALDQMLHLAKNLVGLVVERGPIKARLRSALRRYGVGTF
jgi:Acetyltransferase (GNAT) domain